jgi:hypothetical protein
MCPVSQFIEENKHQALAVIRRNRFYSVLDQDDQDELVYNGLWKVYKSFDSSKASLFRFINVVLDKYILRLVTKKLKIKEKEFSIEGLDFAEKPETVLTDFVTESEWEALSPLINDGYVKSAKNRGLSIRKYKTLIKSIQNNVQSRLD